MSNVRDLFSTGSDNSGLGFSLRREPVSEYFVIDGEARTITPPSDFQNFGVASDESSERVYFECPQFVGDDIDLTTFVIRVNFKNANGELDSYIVEDVESDGSNIHFSWCLSRKVTKYKGTVSFIVCATKTDSEGEILKEWNTTLCSGEVLEGLEVDNPETEESVNDLVTQLVQMQNDAAYKVNAAKAKAIEDIDKAKDAAVEGVANADCTLFANSVKTTVSGKGGVFLVDASPLAHNIKVTVSNFQSVSPGNCLLILEHYWEGNTESIPITKNGTYSMRLGANDAGSNIWVENTTTQTSEDECIITVEYNKDLAIELSNKVDKVAGKGLSANDFTNAHKEVVETAGDNFANSIKATASGEVVRVDDVSPVEHTAKVKISGENIDPATVTVTRCGKNLLDIKASVGTVEGVTFTVNENGSVVANGTATGVATFTLNPSFVYKAGVSYTLSGCPNGGGISTYRLDDTNRNADDGNGGTVTYTNDTVAPIRIRIAAGTTVSNLTFYPMIVCKGESADFEPYNSETYTPNADGTVNIASVSPTMTLFTDTAGVNIDVVYNQDTKAAVGRMIVEMLGTYAPTRSYINILGGIDNWVAEEVEDNEGNVIGSRYGQVVNVNNAVITPNSKVDMQISSEQMVIFHEKDLAFVAENEGGVVTVYCIGNVPENDYTMQVTVTEVGSNA